MAPPLKVLLVLTEFPPRIGGMQTHAHYLAKHLHAKGYSIEVVTYHAITRIEETRHLNWDNNVPYPVHRILSRIGHFENLNKLENLAKNLKVDLVYCSTVFYGALRDRLKIPVVARSVGNDVLRPWIVYPYKVASRLLSHKWFEKYLYRYFRTLDYPEAIEVLWRGKRRKLMMDSARQLSLIFANSDFTRKELQAIGVDSASIKVLSGGVESAKFAARPKRNDALRKTLNIPKEHYVVLTACRLEHKKAVDFLIESMPSLLEHFADGHLVIVGRGRKERKLRALARRSPARDRITFAGRVEHDIIQEYYQMADLFVLPSRLHIDPVTGLRDAETMGRVLCEANAASVPTIAANSGGIPSIIRHDVNGLLFESDDTESYLRAISEVRSNPQRTKIRIANGQMLAKHRYDWSVILHTHEASFLSCHAEGKALHV